MTHVRSFHFVRDVGPKDWRALPREFKAGEIIYEFSGHTYGLDREDAMCGFETIPCRENETDERFFTVPCDMLRSANGQQPMGAYVVRGDPSGA